MAPVRPLVQPLHGSEVTLEGGILARRCQANFQNLFREIDAPRYFEEVFGQTHDEWFAEPEFCGHYLDTAMEFHDALQDPDLLQSVQGLVDTVLRYQREDGYLGTYEPGNEFGRTFSVWNQQFVIMGLRAFYERTGQSRVLQAARRCADFIARHFLEEDGATLLKCLNNGIQHSTIFLEYVHLLEMTGDSLYRDFLELIMRRWRESNIRLVDVADPKVLPMYELGCHKGIEVLICYQGIAEFYRLTGESVYLEACENYWKFLHKMQIGLTGNGSIGEVWNPAARQGFAHISTDLKPNENCVAVGWMMFSALLHSLTGKRCYLDAFERTLYNHLLGAQAIDGRDFSYYQGTYGRKLHETRPGQYSCCRFRGMRMLSKLPRYAVMKTEDGLRVNLYTPLRVETRVKESPMSLVMETGYPASGEVDLTLDLSAEQAFSLSLRIPGWCAKAGLRLNGEALDAPVRDGYLLLERHWPTGKTRLHLDLEMALRHHQEEVEHRPAAALEYGPLLLAVDSRYHPIDRAAVVVPPVLQDLPSPVPDHPHGKPLVAFGLSGTLDGNPGPLCYTDYASAGSYDPANDRFCVWLPEVREGQAEG